MNAGRSYWVHTVAAFLAGGIGVLVTALGAGIGVRYLSKTGLSWTAVAGVVLLLLGVALLAYAANAWRRKVQGWQRLWSIPVVLSAVLLMWSVAQGTMLAIAPRSPLGSTTPASRGLPYTDVTFRTADGARLSAWYVPTVNHAAVVAVPGSGSTRLGALAQAVVLAQHGFGVLLIDPRGQGHSGGHAMDAGWYGDLDVSAAVAFVQHQPGVDEHKVGVLGLSMGGEEAIGAAGSDPAIRAVVAEGATHRTAADKSGYLPGGVAGAIQRVLDGVTYGTAALLSPAPAPGTLHSAIARSAGTRFLLIAGGKVADERDAVAYLRTAAPGRVESWIVAGASHTGALAAEPGEWTARVVRFFAGTLAIGGG